MDINQKDIIQIKSAFIRYTEAGLGWVKNERSLRQLARWLASGHLYLKQLSWTPRTLFFW